MVRKWLQKFETRSAVGETLARDTQNWSLVPCEVAGPLSLGPLLRSRLILVDGGVVLYDYFPASSGHVFWINMPTRKHWAHISFMRRNQFTKPRGRHINVTKWAFTWLELSGSLWRSYFWPFHIKTWKPTSVWNKSSFSNSSVAACLKMRRRTTCSRLAASVL